ncbi:MAG: hypothetical protein LBM13_06140 [Candidatus Ancillula sp.]|jgi:glycosidase|nr:hypothetical protein [Candidatus Ancillula sp.]
MKIFYQFYSLSFTIQELKAWIPFLKETGYTDLYLTPIFQSVNHGYDTIDYRIVDSRFGTNQEFVDFVDFCHQNGLKVTIDGVFNHVGREFWAFKDVLDKRENSQYLNWFKNIDFDNIYSGERNQKPEQIVSSFYFPEDNLNYQGWEGNFDLVCLNHDCPELVNYIMQIVHFWKKQFNIDGIRLDVAYLLPSDFLKTLRKSYPDFLIGEQIHGEYQRLLDCGLNSVTDYNLYKAIWSSIKENNFWELDWTCENHKKDYPTADLLTFLDNHDTNRLGSHFVKHWQDKDEKGAIIKEGDSFDEGQFRLALALLFTLPGNPCVYYGTEYEPKGKRSEGEKADFDVRLKYSVPDLDCSINSYLRYLIYLKKTEPALQTGWQDFEMLYLQNKQYVFKRKNQNEKVFAFNLDITPVQFEVEGFGEISLQPREWKVIV